MSEHDEQAFIMQWAGWHANRYPALDLLFAVPNGFPIPSKNPKTRARIVNYMKAEGLKPGVPDLWLPVARHDYHGLIIENKWKKNKPTEEQIMWLDRLSEEGYLSTVCWSAEEAIGLIIDYLKIECDCAVCVKAVVK